MSWHVLQDQRASAIKNEQGTAIIAALLILMLLSFVAITSTDTTISETSMVRSATTFEQNLYKAESEAMAGVQQMTNRTKPQELLAALITVKYPLLRSANSQNPQSDLANLDTNGDGVIDKGDAFYTDNNDPLNDPLKLHLLKNMNYRIVIQMPIASGSSKSLTQTGSRLYNYAAYGLSMSDWDPITSRFLAVSIVKIGFQKRF